MPIAFRLAGFYFCYYAIVGTFMPYWSLYLEHERFTHFEIGLLSAIAILTRFVAPFVWGWLADRTGKRMLWVRLATCVEAAVWLTIFFIAKNFQTIALIMLVFSFFQNAILAQFEGVTLFWLGDQRQQRYGQVRKWGSVGFIAGVFIVGFILESISIRMLPILLLIIATFAFIWSFSIAEPHNAPQAQQRLEPILPIIKRPVVASFFLIEFILLFSHAPFYSFYSNYLQQVGYHTSQIGFLWSVGVVAEIIMFACANYFFQRFSWRTLVIACLLLTAIRWFMVGLFPLSMPMQFLAQCIHAFSFGLFHLIAMRIIFQNFTAGQQGRGQALYSTMWGMGVALGSILAGRYWQILSGELIFMLAGVSCLIGLFAVMHLPKNIQHQERNAQ
ncbi:MFS transporter [Acinetobacter larvae]|uniref:MFS transporter n=1 Tax=Acinetobacter larvae TaxID=1789224 RepID=A0A1B2LY53_9GAMM|nr:MFS transporter [Acinetobacter larvae]AOA57877.1 MFS transporter [Acinetobacter larvae]